MSPDPYHAIQNAIEHYRLDEILISTLKGTQSAWLSEGLIDRVKESTDAAGRARRVRRWHQRVRAAARRRRAGGGS